MADTPPYSEATVELVARASFESEFGPAGREMWATTSAPSREIYLSEARCILDALAAAGLLLPEGAESRTERHYSPAHDGLLERRVITTPWSLFHPGPKENPDA